jgi:hypothetical protein
MYLGTFDSNELSVQGLDLIDILDSCKEDVLELAYREKDEKYQK